MLLSCPEMTEVSPSRGGEGLGGGPLAPGPAWSWGRVLVSGDCPAVFVPPGLPSECHWLHTPAKSVCFGHLLTALRAHMQGLWRLLPCPLLWCSAALQVTFRMRETAVSKHIFC